MKLSDHSKQEPRNGTNSYEQPTPQKRRSTPARNPMKNPAKSAGTWSQARVGLGSTRFVRRMAPRGLVFEPPHTSHVWSPIPIGLHTTLRPSPPRGSCGGILQGLIRQGSTKPHPRKTIFHKGAEWGGGTGKDTLTHQESLRV